MAKYMVSMINRLDAGSASSYVAAHDAGSVHVIKQDDGTYSVVRLSDTPVQPGQNPYFSQNAKAGE
jgi:hypothetical protein